MTIDTPMPMTTRTTVARRTAFTTILDRNRTTNVPRSTVVDETRRYQKLANAKTKLSGQNGRLQYGSCASSSVSVIVESAGSCPSWIKASTNLLV
jgi:hypothetical protein